MEPYNARAMVKRGLAQIPQEGLERLCEWIEAGEPLNLDGELYGLQGEP